MAVNETALRALIDYVKAHRVAGDEDLEAAVAAVEASLPPQDETTEEAI
jgi:hypothetical protein